MERAPIQPVKANSTSNSDQLGSIRHINAKLKQPLELTFNGDVNDIMIMIGRNGTGKSLMLKLTWAMNMAAMTYIVSRTKTDIHGTQAMISNGVQYIFDQTFAANNLTGSITYDWENGSIYYLFEAGEIIACDYKIPDEVEQATRPIFMSKDMRTFDSIRLYLKMRKALKVPAVLTVQDTEKFAELVDTYRLYDIMYVEMLLAKFRTEQKVPQALKYVLVNYDVKDEVDIIGCERDAGVFYYKDTAGKRVDLHTLGAGHQSIFNMFIANTMLR